MGSHATARACSAVSRSPSTADRPRSSSARSWPPARDRVGTRRARVRRGRASTSHRAPASHKPPEPRRFAPRRGGCTATAPMMRRLVPVGLASLLVACGDASTEHVGGGSQATTVGSWTVNVSTTTGNYLVADQGGGAALMAYSTWAKGWETFTLQDLTQATLTDGDTVTLQGEKGQWASAANGGGGAITVTAPWQRGWEEFTIHKQNGGGAIGDGDTFALQTVVGGQYVSADNGGGGDVTATAPWARGWETDRKST